MIEVIQEIKRVSTHPPMISIHLYERYFLEILDVSAA